MESKAIYDKIENEENSAEIRNTVKAYLTELIRYRNRNLEESRDIAYEVAGLLSTKYASTLKENDPLLQVLLLANSLELPDEHQGEASWSEVEKLVASL